MNNEYVKKTLYVALGLVAVFCIYRLIAHEMRRTEELNARTRYNVQKIDSKTEDNKASTDLRYTYKQLKSIKLLEEATGSKEAATQVYLLRNK